MDREQLHLFCIFRDIIVKIYADFLRVIPRNHLDTSVLKFIYLPSHIW